MTVYEEFVDFWTEDDDDPRILIVRGDQTSVQFMIEDENIGRVSITISHEDAERLERAIIEALKPLKTIRGN